MERKGREAEEGRREFDWRATEGREPVFYMCLVGEMDDVTRMTSLICVIDHPLFNRVR